MPENTNQLHPVMDIRQSPQWSDYLATLGWTTIQTQRNVCIRIYKSPIGVMVKIQRATPLNKDDLEEIEKICRFHKAMFIKIEPYVGQDVELLKQSDYMISMFPLTPSATYYIHLEKSEAELWNNVSHSCKYSINRAKREGVRIEIIKQPDEKRLAEFYEVLKVTGKLQKFYVPPIKQIFDQARAFGENGYLIMSYDSQNRLCGGKWHVTYQDLALYISGGTSALGRKDKSGYLLVWESILFFKSLGLKTFDLEGKDDKRFPSLTAHWGGFTHFKEKFGGEEIVFPYPYVKYLSPVMKFLNKYAAFGV